MSEPEPRLKGSEEDMSEEGLDEFGLKIPIPALSTEPYEDDYMDEQDLFQPKMEPDEIWDVFAIVQGHGHVIVKSNNNRVRMERKPNGNYDVNILRFAPPGEINCGQDTARQHLKTDFIYTLSRSQENLLKDKNYLFGVFLYGSDEKEEVEEMYKLNIPSADVETYIRPIYEARGVPQDHILLKIDGIKKRLNLLYNKLFIKYTENVSIYAEKQISIYDAGKHYLSNVDVKMYFMGRTTKQIKPILYHMPYEKQNIRSALFTDILKFGINAGEQENHGKRFNVNVVDSTCSVFKTKDGEKISPEISSGLKGLIANVLENEGTGCTSAFGGKITKSIKKKRNVIKIKTKRRSKRRTTKSNKRRTKRRY